MEGKPRDGEKESREGGKKKAGVYKGLRSSSSKTERKQKGCAEWMIIKKS